MGLTHPRPRSPLQPGLLTLDRSQRAPTQTFPAVPWGPKTCPFWVVTLGWRKGLELIQKDKVHQTSYFSSFPPPPQLSETAGCQPAARCCFSNLHGHGQGSRTDQSLTEITPSWLHKGGLSHCLGMHVTHEVGGAPVPSHLMLRHQLPLKSGLKGLGKSLPN